MIIENCVGFVEDVLEEDAEQELEPDEEDLLEIPPAERGDVLVKEIRGLAEEPPRRRRRRPHLQTRYATV